MRISGFRRLTIVLALIMAAVFIFSACAGTNEKQPGILSGPGKTQEAKPEKTPKPEKQHTFVKFSEMDYLRPDAAQIAAAADRLTDSLGEYSDTDNLQEAFDEVDALYCEYDKMYAIAMIRASMDRSEPYWAEEERVLLNGYPTLDKASGALMIALYESPHKEAIEKEWDKYFFDYIENAYFTNDITKPLYEREAGLESEQKERLALATIDYKGEALTYEDIQAIDEYYDWRDASLIWYEEYNEEFGQRYIELVKTRNEIAKALGFESYSDYSIQYRHKDYTTDMVYDLTDDIAEKLVPIYEELQNKGRYRPEVEVSYEDFIEFFGKTLNGMGPELYEALDTMIEYELCDMEPRPYKSGGAFTMYISGYELPFVLGSYTDDFYSMITVAHEFGHFYYGYSTMLEPPANNDLSEVHSQSMELLMANHFGDVFDEDAAYALLYDSLFRMFTTITGQPYYASLELRAYSLSEEELTVDKLNEIAVEEARRFGMGVYFPEYVMYDWVTVPHIFHNPLTTFGYVTSALASMELWEVSTEDEAAAIEMYDKTIHREEGTVFLDALKSAGFTSPFEEGRIDELAQWAKKYLVDEELR